MAPRNRAYLEESPETKIARRFATRHNLQVPVDVEGLARKLADLEEDSLPDGVDAVLVNDVGVRARPLIVIEKSQHYLRRRFTIAHELGHLVLPWHIGIVGCHPTDPDDEMAEYMYRADEASANRFASELLIPSEWARAVIGRESDLQDAFRELLKAQASDPATVIATLNLLPPGYVVATVINGRVGVAGASPGTAAKPPNAGGALGSEPYAEFEKRSGEVRGNSSVIRWWKFEAESLQPAGESSSEILERILRRGGFVGAKLASMRSSIAGVVGYGADSFGYESRAQLASVLLQRLVGKERLAWIRSDPELRKYAHQRAIELYERKKGQ